MSTLAALPVFRFGVWRDAEPTVIATFVLGAFAWLWNGWIFFKHKSEPLPCTLQLSLGLACWATLSSFFAPYPLLSFLGSPQLAEGPALFFCFSGFLIAAYRMKSHRSVVIAVSLCALGMIAYGAYVNPLPLSSALKLFFFPDYLGLFAVLVPCLIYYIAYQINATSKFIVPITLIGFLAGIAVAYLADNRGALVIILVCGLGGWLITWLSMRFTGPKIQKYILILASSAIIVIPLAIYILIIWVGQNYQAEQLGEETLLYSLWSRSLMFEVTLRAFGDTNILSYVFGNGFGHSLFAIQNYLVFSGQDFLNPTWDTFARNYVHTHSIPYEIFFSSGPVAILLYLSIFIFWIKEAAPQHKPIVVATATSYIAIASLWFEFATIIALLGFVIAISLKERQDRTKIKRFSVPLKAVTSCVIGFCLMTAAGWIYQKNIHLDKQIFLADQNKGFNPVEDDRLRGNVSFQRALREGYRYITMAPPERTLQYDDYLWVQYLTEVAQQQLRNNPANTIIMEYLLLASDFQNIERPEKDFKALKNLILSEWSYAASILLETAPHRSELLIPYLTYAVSPQAPQSEKEWAEIILSDLYQYDTTNPIALWFIGQMELANNENEKRITAIENMLKAVEQYNLRRFLAIPDDLIEQLKNAHKILIKLRTSP
jgi:hypothetical protein